MNLWVADASVAVKWLVPRRDDEDGVPQALDLLFAYKHGEIALIQPVHWMAEVAAVLARLTPATLRDDIEDLQSFQIPIADSPIIWQTAGELAVSLNHHLFDTLYHAVALCTPNARLVTADRRYYAEAAPRGRIVLLDEMPG